MSSKRQTFDMTKQEALDRAIEIVNQSQIPEDEKISISNILTQCIRSVSAKKWNEESILAACGSVVSAKGRLLTSDFGGKGMPSSAIVNRVFKMSAAKFRDKYFPLPTTLSPRSPYSQKSERYWTQLFIYEYKRISPSGEIDYNNRRNSNVPSWITIAKMNGVQTWRDLLERLSLKDKPRTATKFSITSVSESEIQLRMLEQNGDDDKHKHNGTL